MYGTRAGTTYCLRGPPLLVCCRFPPELLGGFLRASLRSTDHLEDFVGQVLDYEADDGLNNSLCCKENQIRGMHLATNRSFVEADPHCYHSARLFSMSIHVRGKFTGQDPACRIPLRRAGFCTSSAGGAIDPCGAGLSVSRRFGDSPRVAGAP